eukprot:snap_masked-scaffold580_size130538-processed-gene-0.13 protein:Tk07498 transcript:snap_masked-scaffold580_size130538-processed-gene-0.13-mRNA-1 annotation:"hypothetical protein DAPPUDRAFT_109281"
MKDNPIHNDRAPPKLVKRLKKSGWNIPIAEQHGYLRSCLELKLQQLLSIKTQDGTVIEGPDGCIAKLKEIFVQQIPILTRRYNFFKCDQRADSNIRSIVAANSTTLKCLGSADLELCHLGKYTSLVTAFVTPDIKNQILISWHSMIDLGMINRTFPYLPEDRPTPAGFEAPATKIITCHRSGPNDPPEEMVKTAILGLLDQYSSVFDSSSELKAMKGPPMTIHLKDDTPIKPCRATVARNIPFGYRSETEKELQFMVKSGIIEPVSEPSDWVSPSLVVPKPNGSVRLVVNYIMLFNM